MSQVAVTLINDGPRNAVAHVFIKGNGLGEETDFVILDPETSFDPALPAKPTLTIEKLWYDLNGFSVVLEGDYLATDTPIWSMSAGSASYMDFGYFAGIKDRSNELDGKGKLKITTSGLGAGDTGSIIVHVRKN